MIQWYSAWYGKYISVLIWMYWYHTIFVSLKSILFKYWLIHMNLKYMNISIITNFWMTIIDQDLNDRYSVNCLIITLISILHQLSHVELLYNNLANQILCKYWYKKPNSLYKEHWLKVRRVWEHEFQAKPLGRRIAEYSLQHPGAWY